MGFLEEHQACCCWIIFAALAVPALAEGPSYLRPRRAKQDLDFTIQGEYEGTVTRDAQKQTVGLQLVALGKGQFLGTGYMGGLPGAGWNREQRISMQGTRAEDGTVTLETERGTLKYQNGTVVALEDEREVGTLHRVHRKSPTLQKKPPSGAIVLFDGTSGAAWENGDMDRRLLKQGQTSKQKFGSHELHIEFRLPYQPEQRGQGRGNSGIYLQGRYEVQMLDSFGLAGQANECGGIYSIKAPDVNMCFPPLTWQTYDIDFTAARYDDQGRLVHHPRMTVRHNGVVIQQDVELRKSTTAAPLKPGPEPGPVYLQDHRQPVRYRNIWVVPKA